MRCEKCGQFSQGMKHCRECNKEIAREKAREHYYKHKCPNGCDACPDCGGKRKFSKTYCDECSDRRRIESRKLAQRKRKHKEKARMKNLPREAIDRIDVFIRDNWMCWLCGTPTNPNHMSQPIDDAPELDHIIPLSVEGSSHTWDNVQCACRRCNGTKSNDVCITLWHTKTYVGG